jgi:hypothetical protein
MSNKTQPAKLLKATEVMRVLGVGRTMFYGDKTRGAAPLVDALRKHGLKTVRLASRTPGGKPRVRYLASSLEKVIERAALTETPLG